MALKLPFSHNFDTHPTTHEPLTAEERFRMSTGILDAARLALGYQPCHVPYIGVVEIQVGPAEEQFDVIVAGLVIHSHN